MKCLLCGKDYINLGVHLRHKHHVYPADYREEFGMMKTAPLVDADLSEHMSKSIKRRLLDPDYLAEVTARCKKNAAKNIGQPAPEHSKAAKEEISERNRQRHAQRLVELAPVVAEILRTKKTLADVYRDIGMGSSAAKKCAILSGVRYNKTTAKEERDKRAKLTMQEKALARIANVMPYFYTTKSAVEMCRMAGISTKTYQTWVRLGLIQRHQNGRSQLKVE